MPLRVTRHSAQPTIGKGRVCGLRSARGSRDPGIRPLVGLAIILAAFAGPAQGQAPWHEGFEGPNVSWRPAGADSRFQAELHQRVPGEAHTGQACERLRISSEVGSRIYFAHDIGRVRIIDELSPSVWLRADRTGLQIFARVVLPRTQDPRTGHALVIFVEGETYHQFGRWQQLRVQGIPASLARHTRALRTQLGPNVDPREAYVDQVLLNLYGGPGVTNVSIDDLEVAGYVAVDSAAPAPTRPATMASLPRADGSPSAVPAAAAPGVVGQSPRAAVHLSGSILMVEGRPTLVRAIQHQGEPLSVLRKLGFNAVWLPQLPSTEMLDEARQLGLWLVCPPPRPPVATGPSSDDDALPPIGPAYDRVLAWDLGSGLSSDRLAATRQWAEQVRLADRLGARPLICRPESELRSYSRLADLLVIGRAPLGTSLELADYGTWVRERPRLARPGTPIWTNVQTQPAPTLVQQWQALSPGAPPPATMASEQIRLLVYTAVTAGSRGLLFESYSPLTAEDADTRQRAATLELLNLELDLIEPWLAAGNFVAAVSGTDPEVVGGVIQSERARLLVPLWSAAGAQLVAGQSAGNGVSFVVPGVPESNSAYLLAPGALEPLRHKRVTGGTRVTLDEFGLSALVLLTQDPLIVNSLARRAAQVGPRAAELQRQLAADKLQEIEQVGAQLAGIDAAADSQLPRWLAAARGELQTGDRLASGRQYAAAYLRAERAMRPLRMAQRAYWQAAIRGLRSPVASPAAVSFRTLGAHRQLMARVARTQPGENRLPQGELEDLGAMLHAGWNHFQHPTPGLASEANLAPGAAHSGRFGLRLAARPLDPESGQTLVESPPVWIVSPAISLDAGQVVVIRGWVQIPAPLTGSVDGLVILDSISGEPLAERIGETVGWQEFVLYRVAPAPGPMSLTFALSGLGEVWLDDVTVKVLGD